MVDDDPAARDVPPGVVEWGADDRVVRDAKEIAQFAFDIEKGPAEDYDRDDGGRLAIGPRVSPPLYETNVSVRWQIVGMLAGFVCGFSLAEALELFVAHDLLFGVFGAGVGAVVANVARSAIHWLRQPRGEAAIERRRFRVTADGSELVVFVGDERRRSLPVADVVRVRSRLGRIEVVCVDGSAHDLDARFADGGEAEAMAQRLDACVARARRGPAPPFR